MAAWIEPVTLEGEHVVLEPLALDHAGALAEATADGELWKLWYTFVPAPDQVANYIDTALEGRDRHGDLPFAVRHRQSGRVIGSTRFFRADPDNRRLELGHTWYAWRQSPWSCAPTGTTTPRATPLPASAPSRTACCDTTR
jgi:RimJ/RimL family protein N-acetyltransferase